MQGSEYTTWGSEDRKHSQAYAILFNKQSKQIARLLDRKVEPHKDTFCLNCHVHPDYDEKQHHPNHSPTFGVSCESCHGAAQYWLAEHYQPGWTSLTTAQKQLLGMKDTKSLTGQANTCVAYITSAHRGMTSITI